ncbi:MAG: hypothetical protein ABIQ35_13485, partial [Verrucomicrobiota bacterium]
MKRKVLHWTLGIAGALIGVVLLAFFSIDPAAKFWAERRIKAETGLEATIGKLTVGVASSSLQIQNLMLKNKPEFGAGPLIEMPELFVAYDREAMRAGKLKLKVVRVEIARIHVVENKDGKKNIDDLQKRPAKIRGAKGSRRPTPSRDPALSLEGIDSLDVTIGNLQFTNLRDPSQNLDQPLSIRNEMFKDLKTKLDYETAAALLTIKAGASFLFSGGFANFGHLV